MNEQVKRQLIKSLAYDTDREQIKANLGVSDADIDSISAEEIKAEKDYYCEMGYIK